MIVAVMGPPRSGTSMTAGVLHRLGVDMGRRLERPPHYNPTGYYEDWDFLELHLRLLGQPPPGHPKFDDNSPVALPVALTAADRDAYAAACSRRSAESPHWGVKDPKLCYLLAEFARACRPAGVNLVVIRRRESAVRASLAAMYMHKQRDVAKLARLMDNYIESAAQQLAAWTGRVCALQYEEVVADPAGAVGILARFLDLTPTAEAVAFVDPALNRMGTS